MKKLLALGLSIAAVSSLAACGEKYDIEFWYSNSKTEYFDGLGEQFEEYYFEKTGLSINVGMIYKGSYDPTLEATKTAIIAGNQPNLVMGYADHFADYLSNKALQELDSFIAADTAESTRSQYDAMSADDLLWNQEDTRDFERGGFWDDSTCYDAAGTVYSLPFAKSTEVMFYNNDVVKAYAESIGTTVSLVNLKDWDTIVSISEFAGQKFTYSSASNLVITLLEQAGSPYTSFDEATGKGTNLFIDGGANETAAKATVNNWFTKVEDSLYILPTGTYGSAVISQETADGGKPEIWMEINSTAGASYYSNKYLDEDGKETGDTFDLQVGDMPQLRNNDQNYNSTTHKVISQGPSIAMLSSDGVLKLKDEEGEVVEVKENDLTWDFMKWLTLAETSAQISMDFGYVPARRTAASVSSYEDYLTKDTTIVSAIKLARTQASQGLLYVSPAFVGSSDSRSAIYTAAMNLYADVSNGTSVDIDKAWTAAKKYINDLA